MRLFSVISVLLLSLASPVFACNLSLTSYISGNDVTIANLEGDNNALENCFAQNIEGGTNIKIGSLVSQDMSEAVSPITRWDEAFNDFTFSGMLPATDSDLDSDISAGTSYVNGIRIETNATSHTYTASKDTYAYINAGGYFVFEEVANGAGAPSTPTDSLLLAKVVTNGTQITSVEDLRATAIQVEAQSTIFPQHYRDEAFFIADSTTTFHAEPGGLAIGSSIYTRTSDTSTKQLSTAANWIEGAFPSGDNDFIFAYAYNNSGSTWDILFSSSEPVYSDVSQNTDGILRYYESGGTNYRAIGWAYMSAEAVQAYNISNFKDGSVYNATKRESTTDVSTSSTSYVDLPNTELKFYSTGRPLNFAYNTVSAGDANSRQAITILDVDGTDELPTRCTNSDTFNTGDGETRYQSCAAAFQETYSQGEHTVEVQFREPSGGGATTVYDSYISFEEI